MAPLFGVEGAAPGPGFAAPAGWTAEVGFDQQAQIDRIFQALKIDHRWSAFPENPQVPIYGFRVSSILKRVGKRLRVSANGPEECGLRAAFSPALAFSAHQPGLHQRPEGILNRLAAQAGALCQVAQRFALGSQREMF